MLRRAALLVAYAGLVVAAVGCGTKAPDPVVEDPVVENPATQEPAAQEPASSPSSAPADGEPTPWPVYYVRPTPMGPRLIAEWRAVSAGDPAGEAARLIAEDPNDPDYLTLWPDSVAIEEAPSAGNGDGVVAVVLEQGADLGPVAGLSEADARLAITQLVRTLQGVEPSSPAAVAFSQGGREVDTLFGIDVTDPVQAGPDLEELALMNVVSPQEGDVVTDGVLRASGWNNGFEATVWWRILDGKEVVREDAALSGGWMEERLFSWDVEIDVGDLPPGEYTFVAGNDDPTGGTEGMGTSEDTKTFVIR